MEFKATTTHKRGPIRLQFYRNPPSETIELNELEQYAVDRMRILKCVEAVRQDFKVGSSEYDERLTSELTKLGPFGKSLTTPTIFSKNATEDIRRDIISHFILQVAYCRGEDLRRWFINQEVDLFRYRFLLERNVSSFGPDVISDFLTQNRLHFSHLSDSERLHIRQQLIAGTAASGIDFQTTAFYKVYFTEVPELVRSRRIFIRAGFAYVPDSDLVSLVVSHFRTSLSCNLARLGLTLGSRMASEEFRVLPLLASLSSRYLGEDYSTKAQAVDSIKAEQVDVLARQQGVFPPCMSQLHEALKAQHHLRHAGRMQYGLFLKGIGLPLEESLKFWRNAFAPKYDSEQFAKSYAYNIRHNYGKEGKRADYTPYSCIKIISSNAPGAGDYHGCPFRHMDPELLRQRLSSSGRIPSDIVDNIVQRSKERLYHLSCREYFRALHKLDVDAMSGVTIMHPNQYFDLSQKVLRGELGSSKDTADKVRVTKVKLSDTITETTTSVDETMDESCIDSSTFAE
ncbi:Eukaryotic-type DNA primase large subunit [Paragonimus heterotremus]|uniref:DNA primase large subunit n=1 Tax=Paragonimus heterotremus TaxID=100268 RepID=A0A8J4WI04_9TREM|nr:Eukaryotic-type DNA primase large subunit [Paragonimus heterotremus]